jgi:uncharacterized protein with FMN-binding domain
MRRIALWLLATVAALVLLLSYRTSTGGRSLAARPGVLAGGTGTAQPGGTDSTGSRTVDGDVVATRWGAVQVRIRVSGARITEVTALRLPDGNPRDREINARAEPALRAAALAAQSADIDSVSGATVTSDGYRRSLQSAIDAAGLR